MAFELSREIIQSAQATEKLYGVPTSVTLAQAIQESSGKYKNGMSMLASKYNNLFGVKASSNWSGKVVSMPTKEYVNGKEISTYANFKQYDNITQSTNDHGKLLTNKRYISLTQNATTVEEYAQAVKKGGYATDPNYAQNLVNVMNKYNLKDYDVGVWKEKTQEIAKTNKIPSADTGNTSVVTGDKNTSNSKRDELIKNGLLNPDGSNKFVGDGSNVSTITNVDDNLKFWAKIIVMIATLGVCVLAVIFLMKAIGQGDKLDMVGDVAKMAVTKKPPIPTGGK